jgi:hypothetical protein
VLTRAGRARSELPAELLVCWNDRKYCPYAYRIEFAKDGSAAHYAILHDLKANSVVTVELEKVTAPTT